MANQIIGASVSQLSPPASTLQAGMQAAANCR